MFDRFGSAGFLAAYHTGPSRVEQRLATGRPLPTDTVAYVTAVTPLLGNGQGEHAAFRIKRAVPWQEAPLFVERMDARRSTGGLHPPCRKVAIQLRVYRPLFTPKQRSADLLVRHSCDDLQQ